jgi:hypothetical protein
MIAFQCENHSNATLEARKIVKLLNKCTGKYREFCTGKWYYVHERAVNSETKTPYNDFNKKIALQGLELKSSNNQAEPEIIKKKITTGRKGNKKVEALINGRKIIDKWKKNN